MLCVHAGRWGYWRSHLFPSFVVMDDAVGECNRPSTDAYASRLLPMGGRFWFPPGVRQVHSCRQGAVMGRLACVGEAGSSRSS